MRYIDGDEHRENNEAKLQGIPVPTIAERRHMEVSELCQLMGWPQWQEVPAESAADTAEFDLWSTDRLDGQL